MRTDASRCGELPLVTHLRVLSHTVNFSALPSGITREALAVSYSHQ